MLLIYFTSHLCYFVLFKNVASKNKELVAVTKFLTGIIQAYLTRLQSNSMDSSSFECWELFQVWMDHADLAEHAGLLIWDTCWVEAGCVIGREEMPSFPGERMTLL